MAAELEVGEDLTNVVHDLLGKQDENASTTALPPNATADPLNFNDSDERFMTSLDTNPYFNHSAADGDKTNPFVEIGEVLSGKGGACQRLLYRTVSEGSAVRVWDVIILLPNLVFMLFLLARLRKANEKLRATNAPIFRAFYLLVLVAATVGTARSLVSMTLSGATTADQLLWLLLRFTLLATELSVLVFGLVAGHLDSRESIRRVVIVAALVSLAFSTAQAAAEFGFEDKRFVVERNGVAPVRLFGHGGAFFWLLTSALSTVIYLFVLLLPFLPCRHALTLPHKRSFYQYVGYLLLLNSAQTVGCALLFTGYSTGLCLINLTTYLYFTTFAPLVYFTFLQGFFRTAQPSLLFSYKAQLDEFDVADVDGDVAQGGLPQSASLQFTDDLEENNRPIVMQQQAGVASPESVVNYSFGQGAP